MASSVNLRSGLQAIGALRPDDAGSQQPVALETAVIATGARPGDSNAKRELFTEETQTVLVFERGAVIRLSAAVADGQLLFLTNKKTGKEVVTQVLRKRSFRPTNCYVDLEFTEACPEFWGIEFPKVTAGAPAAAIPQKVAQEDDAEPEIESVKPALPPSLQEVDRLKNEVAQLQTQLKSLTESGLGAESGSGLETRRKAASEITAQLGKKEEETQLEELLAIEAKQDATKLPKRLVAYPKKSANRAEGKSSSKKNFSFVAVTVGVVCAAVGAAYWFGIFGNFNVATKTPATAIAGKPAPGGAAPMTSSPVSSVPVGQKPAAGSVATDSANDSPKIPSTLPETSRKNSAANAASPNSSSEQVVPGVEGLHLTTAGSTPAKSLSTKTSAATEFGRPGANGSGATVSGESKTRKTRASSELNNNASSKPDKSAVTAPMNAATSSGVTANPAAAAQAENDEGGYIEPKLIKAVKPVAPAEALKNYVTGNVSLDALVDASGRVKSVIVLSGPAKLRETAINDMKQYVYEPAKKNGKAVPAHVQVSLQFWYEP